MTALSATERQRRRRQRIAAGKVRLVIEVDETLVDQLLALAGLLDCDDPSKVNTAFGQAVEQLARRQLEAALARRSRVTTQHDKPCYGDGDEGRPAR